MIKRVIEISSEPLRLSVRYGQLILEKPHEITDQPVSIPCEDIGVVVIDHPQACFTHSAIASLVESGASIIFCGKNHLPAGLALPISTNTEVVSRINDQINISKPISKQIWKQLIVGKIHAQADNLEHAPSSQLRLRNMAATVKSGDPSNIEAQAARVYWSVWLSDSANHAAGVCKIKFKRDIDGDGINALLNYGYAILRAGVARAIVSAGLIPALGIHHKNRSNAFALADDLLEPIRPIADRVVRSLVRRGIWEINRDAKQELLGMLHRTVMFEDQTGPLMVVFHRYSASFLRCMRGESKRLSIPTDTGENGA